MATDVYVLAKGVQETMSKQRYGALRRNLIKKGFSEIALHVAMANHCDENGIPQKKMIHEMYTLIEGCGRNALFPKMDNAFSYLRGLYHDLRNGDLVLSEPKSPEQRGRFLCNTCYQIKDKHEQSGRKTEKNTCCDCSKYQSNAYVEKKKKEVQPEMTVEEIETMTEPQIESVKEELGVVVMDKPEPVQGVKVKEVVADSDGATVTIECGINELGQVLMAVQTL